MVVDVGQLQLTQPMMQAEVPGHAAGDQLSTQQSHSSSTDLRQNYQAATASQAASSLCGDDPAKLTSEVISIFGEHMPSDPTQPSFAFLQGFMSLRLLLLRSSRSLQEEDVVNTMLTAYSSYKAGGRTRQDIALMLARDFMFMNLQAQPQQMQMPPQQMQQQQQHQSQNNFIYNNMPPHHPTSPQIQFGGNGIKLDNKTYNPENMNVMHTQNQPHPQQDSYTQGSNQQQHDYSHLENCSDTMLNELLSLPQDLMAAMTATATAAAAANLL